MKMEDYSKYYVQGSDHYLIPKDVFIELFNEMINWKEENKILKENAEHNDKVVDKVNWENMLLRKENKQLEDNWNDLKKYAKEVISTDNELYGTDLLDKMLELEKGKNNEKISKTTG